MTRVWVGAFGKHPGWDDHIADQGLETEFLVRVRRQLYVEGIGGNIDAGSWDELGEDERAAGFDHVFLWRALDGLVVGRLWSSSDGKGRKRYPMIVCAQARGLACEWVVGPCLERLEQLASDCRQSQSAGEVISAVDRARAELRSMGASAPAASKTPLSSTAAMVQIDERLRATVGDDAFVRVAYQLEREFSSFLLLEDASDTKSRTVDVRPRHMRVPACEPHPADACALWMRFLYERVDPAVPALLFGRLGDSFIDLVVGEPGRGQVFALQTLPKRMPLTTDIPYNVDNQFREWLGARIDRAGRGEVRDADPGRVNEEPPRVRLAAPKFAVDTKLIAIGAVAVAGLVAVILILMAILSGNEKQAGTTNHEKPKAQAPSSQEPESGSALKASSEQMASFAAWCRAYDAWLSDLDYRAPKSTAFKSDEYLSARVISVLSSASGAGTQINPRYVASNPSGSTATDLLEKPPDNLGSPELIRATRDASQLIETLTAAFRDWPLRAQAESLGDTLIASGLKGPGESLKQLAMAATPGQSKDLVAAAEALMAAMTPSTLEAVAVAKQFDEDLAAIDAGLKDKPDRALSEVIASVRAKIGEDFESASIADLSPQSLDLANAGLVKSTLEAIRGPWKQVDQSYFVRSSLVYQREFADEGDPWKQLTTWQDEVVCLKYQGITEKDPRTKFITALDAVESDLGKLSKQAGGEFAEQLASLRSGLDTIRSDAHELLGLPWDGGTRNQITSELPALESRCRQVRDRVLVMGDEIGRDINERIADLRSRSGSYELASINTLWEQSRDVLLRGFESDGDSTALFLGERSLRERLKRVESATAVDRVNAELPEEWNAAVVSEASAKLRDNAVESAVQSASWSPLSEVGEEVVVASIARDVAAGEARLEAALTDLKQIATDLEMCYGLEEPTADGSSIASRRARVQSDGVSESIERLAPQMHRDLKALDDLREAKGNRASVARLVQSTLPGSASVHAWLELSGVQPAWPAGESELRTDLAAAERARAAIARISNDPRRGFLSTRVDELLAQRWATAMAGAKSWDELNACASLRDQCGGQVSSLSPGLQFALALDATRTAVVPGQADTENQQLARQLVRRADELGIKTTDQWGGALARVRELAGEDLEAVPALDPGTIGPARVGWQLGAESTDESLVYKLPGHDDVRLTFRLLEMSDGSTSFLCTEELSAKVVLAVNSVDGELASELLDYLPWAEWGPSQQKGMFVWTWEGTKAAPGLKRAPLWMLDWSPPSGMESSGDSALRPGGDEPFQRLTFQSAVFLAHRLGCRLPTIEEWKAAYAACGSMDAGAGWNLRDQTVSRYLAAVSAQPAVTGASVIDEFSFDRRRSDVTCYPFDDGALWLQPVSGGPDAPFRHIVGNAMEFVIMGGLREGQEILGVPGSQPTLSPAEYKRAAGLFGGGAIGGSVFSASARAVDSAEQLVGFPTPWSDVGLRLAFSPEEGRVRRSVGSRLSEVLNGLEYVGNAGGQ